MESSRYNIYIEDYPRNGYILIYNLYTRQIACVKERDPEKWSEVLFRKMKSKGFVVSSRVDELNQVLQSYINEATDSDELTIMLILTRRCNCKCIYCYEEQQHTQFGEFDNVDTICEDILKLMENKKSRRLKIIYYGGEPLLRKDLITKISIKLYASLGENLKFSIITNGTLISSEDFELWKTIGLNSVKVTIDGNAISHNQRRPLLNGSGTYSSIVANLSKIHKLVNIVLNVVVDDKVFGLAELVDELRESNVNPEFSLCVREPNDYSPEEKANLILTNATILSNKGAYQSTKISFDHGIICMGKRTNNYGIDAYGTLYRCNGNFDSKFGCLNLQNQKPFIPIRARCRECTYLPICYGGCIYEERCEKSYFENVVPGLIKIYCQKPNS